MDKKNTLQNFFYAVFSSSGKSKREQFFEQFLFTVIVLNVFFAVLETVHPLSQEFGAFFWWFDAISVAIFSIEYGLRLWVAPLHKGYEEGGMRVRVRFALRPIMLFDLAVILPFYLSFLFPLDVRWLRIFRLLRIFRTFRIPRYSLAFEHILNILRREKEELFAIFWLMIVLLSVTSSIVFLAEHNVPGTQFTSIPASFWWGVTTLTTIGYGDMVPITPWGKFFGAVTSVLGVGIFALPAGLIGSSFYNDVSKRRERQIQKLGQEIDILKTSTEESEGFIEELFQRQNRKIRELEKALLQAHEELRTKVGETKKTPSSTRKKKKS